MSSEDYRFYRNLGGLAWVPPDRRAEYQVRKRFEYILLYSPVRNLPDASWVTTALIKEIRNGR